MTTPPNPTPPSTVPTVVTPILDYAPPVRRKWLLRTLLIILLIAAGAAIGGIIGDSLQPDLYIFEGSLALQSSAPDTDTSAAKQTHIAAIRANIPAAAALLTAQGTPISAAEFSDHLTLKD